MTCKNEEDPVINEGARVFTTFLWRFFSDAQGQLSPQFLVRSGRISNSFEMLYMSSLPESIKKIRSKMKALEWSQAFPLVTLWELSVAMDTIVPIQPDSKPNAAFPPPQ